MRKLLFGLMLLVSVPTIAQKTTVEHLTFVGIPICGTLENFDKQITEKGFKHVYGAFYDGVFGGEETTIQICVTEAINNVYSVVVYANETDNEEDIKTLLNVWVRRYESKYQEQAKLDDDGSYTIIVKGKNDLIGGIFISYFKVEEKYKIGIQYLDNIGNRKDCEIKNKDL